MYGASGLFGEKGRVLCNMFEGPARFDQYAWKLRFGRDVTMDLLVRNAVERAIIVKAEISRVNDVVSSSCLRKVIQRLQAPYSQTKKSVFRRVCRSKCRTDL